MKNTFLISLSIFFSASLLAQRPINNSADILQELKKLNVVGNALYIAAHPDDENTRMISWLENDKMIRTAYLSLTRGDGGQNLIGTEKGDAMGVLRTQELLQARAIDGGEQFFSRAVDFGYSKTAEETLEIWDEEKILSDVVWVIRKFKPDIIITRFPSDSRGGHGHHTASAQLAEKAFKLAADKTSFPEQLKLVEPWQAKRILWDVYWWNTEIRDAALKDGGIISVNIGAYNETLGLSYSEIASDSRSQHKSQGFGTERTRGNKMEYLQHTAGAKAENDLFEGIDLSWSRVENANAIQNQLNAIIENFDVNQPSSSIQDLVQLHSLMKAQEENFYIKNKLEDLKRIIQACAGIYAEALADDYNYSPLEEIKGKFKLIVRSKVPFQLMNVQPKLDSTIDQSAVFLNNEEIISPFSMPASEVISHPYWLFGDYYGVFNVSDPLKIGKAENEPITKFTYSIRFLPNKEIIDFTTPIDYKWSERVDGELHRNVIISPPVTATPSKKVLIFSDNASQTIDLLLEANQENIESSIKMIAPKGWKVSPEQVDFNFSRKSEQKLISFSLNPPENASQGEIYFEIDGIRVRSVQRINYPHIKPQQLFPEAKLKAVRMNLKKNVTKIAYLTGSGDDVAENLRQVGYSVAAIEAEELPLLNLNKFETIIVGIRAFNTEKSLLNGTEILTKYVENGGNLIVQYNTNRGLITEKIGPYPFRISRNRVTKENAKATFLKPNHPLLNSPNKIDQNDFNDWVQERGLYFADEWDEKYETIISWNDPNEAPHEGSVLVCDYGKGHFIYTGISFFRQLPAGVPGAYRLLSNMISYGK